MAAKYIVLQQYCLVQKTACAHEGELYTYIRVYIYIYLRVWIYYIVGTGAEERTLLLLSHPNNNFIRDYLVPCDGPKVHQVLGPYFQDNNQLTIKLSEVNIPFFRVLPLSQHLSLSLNIALLLFFPSLSV